MEASEPKDLLSELDKIAERVRKFADDINNFVGQQCLDNNYTAQELYAATKVYFETLKEALGPERVKALDRSFQVVSWDPNTMPN